MLAHGKSSNSSRQIILWSTSGKCHLVQRYKTLEGSRNIKNINLAHHPFHQLPRYLYWGILVVAYFFFFFLDERKELISNLCRWWRSLVRPHALPEDHFSRAPPSRAQKSRKGNTGLTHSPFMLATALTACIPEAFAIAPANREGIIGVAAWQSCDWDKVI